jgi:MFS family permease
MRGSADFRLLLAGQTTSQLGTQVAGIAVPLLAVGALQASSLELGLISAASTIPFALIGLPAGAWLDGWRNRPVLIAADLVRAAALLSIPVAGWIGVLSITQLIVVSLVAGTARVFFDIGYQSYLPVIVGREGVLAGNSAMESLRAGSQIAGPGIGGILVSAIGAANLLLTQAATFLVSALTLVASRTREPAPVHESDRPHLWGRILEGLRFVGGNRILRATAAASGLANFSFAMGSAVTIIFLARDLALPSWAVGVLFAVTAVGAMGGAAFTPRLARWVGSARVIWFSLAVTAPLGFLIALAQPGWGILFAVVGMAAGELGQIVYAVTNVSLRQRLCPERILSRVTATMRVLIMGLFPLGALIGGLLGELVGARLTLVAVAVVGAAAPVVLYAALRGNREVEELPAWGQPR